IRRRRGISAKGYDAEAGCIVRVAEQVSVRRTDLRLALPIPARRATVLGDLEDWRAGLTLVGVTVDQPDGAPPDLVVAPARLSQEAVAANAPAVLLEGRGGYRRLVRSGYTVRRFLPLPTLENPDVVLPISRGAVPRYALE